jgi:hypothetical protein
MGSRLLDELSAIGRDSNLTETGGRYCTSVVGMLYLFMSSKQASKHNS